MNNTYWLKQSLDKPLFEDLLWSRPESKQARGKLLIVGGNLHGFSAVAEAYKAALQAGAGTVNILLPEALKKTVAPMLPEAEFAPSTSAGSFSKSALADMLDLAAWADGILLVGNFGHNSQTAVLLGQFLAHTDKPVTLSGDTVDNLYNEAKALINREQTAMIISATQLQKLLKHLGSSVAVTSNMDLMRFVEALHNIQKDWETCLAAIYQGHIVISRKGRVSSTVAKKDVNEVQLAAFSAVWHLQNPKKPFEALTTASYHYLQKIDLR